MERLTPLFLNTDACRATPVSQNPSESRRHSGAAVSVLSRRTQRRQADGITMRESLCCAAPLRKTRRLTGASSQQQQGSGWASAGENMRQTGCTALVLVRLAGYEGGAEDSQDHFHYACCATDHFHRVKNRNFAANYSNPLGCKPTVPSALRENLEHRSFFPQLPALDVPGVIFLPHVSCVLHVNSFLTPPPHCSVLRFLLKCTLQTQRQRCYRQLTSQKQ